jgi:hypothetical protein
MFPLLFPLENLNGRKMERHIPPTTRLDKDEGDTFY